MASVSLVINIHHFEASLKACNPQQVYTILNTWYDRATTIMANELRSRAKGRLKSKVYINMDKLRPPRWARIGVKHPLARIIEGGTGRLGDPAFNHMPNHWPSTLGIMEATGLPKGRAFLVARAIGLRGGNPAQPFIRPTYEAKRGEVERLMDVIAEEVLSK